MKYFLKQVQFNRGSVASSWHGRDTGMLYQVAIVETKGPKDCFFTIFDNQDGGWRVTPFPTRLVFAGDRAEGVSLLKRRYEIEYQTPQKKRTMAP